MVWYFFGGVWYNFRQRSWENRWITWKLVILSKSAEKRRIWPQKSLRIGCVLQTGLFPSGSEEFSKVKEITVNDPHLRFSSMPILVLRTLRRLSCFPRGKSTQRGFAWSSHWRVWICPGLQQETIYERIKAYVLEKHGLKVFSLYISQVKRNCGLDVGQNYNPSKKRDSTTVPTRKGRGYYGDTKARFQLR